MTNFERLKNMNIDELAEFIDDVQTDALFLEGTIRDLKHPTDWKEWMLQDAPEQDAPKIEIKNQLLVVFVPLDEKQRPLGIDEKIISTDETHPLSKRAILELKEHLCKQRGCNEALILNIILLELEENEKMEG